MPHGILYRYATTDDKGTTTSITEVQTLTTAKPDFFSFRTSNGAYLPGFLVEAKAAANDDDM